MGFLENLMTLFNGNYSLNSFKKFPDNPVCEQQIFFHLGWVTKLAGTFHGNPKVIKITGLPVKWNTEFHYVFPVFSLQGNVAAKLHWDNANVIKTIKSNLITKSHQESKNNYTQKTITTQLNSSKVSGETTALR